MQSHSRYIRFLILQTIFVFSISTTSKAKEPSLHKLSKACKANDITACNKISDIQARQARKEVSIQSSIENRIKCNKEDARACSNEGFDEYALGNLKSANIFYEKACKLKLADACSNRAYMASLANQKEVSKKFYIKACELANMRACNILGTIEISNDDLYEAYKYFVKSCEGGFSYACYNMGWVQAQWQNFKLANKYYVQACNLKVKESCENIEVIAARFKEATEKNSGPEKEQPREEAACEKIKTANYLPLVKPVENSPLGSDFSKVDSAVNAAITKVNYSIFNRKKECGEKNIRLPAGFRLPYTGLEVKD